MKILSFILGCLLLTSCLTVKRIEKNCDKFAKICTTPVETVVEYRDTTVYILDTVFYYIKADTVQITDTVQIIDNFCQLQTIYKKFGLINVSAGVASSILKVNAWLTDSTILIPHRDTVFINDAISNTTTTQTITIDRKYIPAFYKFTFWVFIASVIVAVCYVLVKYSVLKSAFRKVFP